MSQSFHCLLSLRSSRLMHTLALAASFISLSASFAVAGQRPNGQFFFDHPPQLVRTGVVGIATTDVSGATYEFTITVPKNAGAPLQAITIAPHIKARAVEFNLNQSQAIAANGANVPLASIGGKQDAEATIVFEQLIQPGETVTISLKAERNPSLDGVYLFGVTAYPVGEQNNGLFLGYGRVQIYGHGG